ncbi:MAG: cupredoxin domain-containing protein, partial [Burkholderiaceae bacterium]
MKRIALCLGLLLTSALVLAHDPPSGTNAKAAVRKEQKPWGIAGDPKAVVRTVEVKMSDDMRFVPDRLEVKQGQTIRFVLRNS